jgi:hypothetical protein
MCPARRKLWVAVDIDWGSVRETNPEDEKRCRAATDRRVGTGKALQWA